MSLYLKYRPQSFSSLVGQNHIATILKNAISKNMVSHAYLFCGPRGTGKTTTARLVAKALNCTNLVDNLEPCNECEICTGINNGSLTDVIEIDAASNRGIDEMRELRETVKFAPSRAKNKVYIIDEVHMLTTEAFNALLKTLEEPPENVFFILATTEVHKIPHTILSRCQRFDFKRIDSIDIFERLAEIAKSEQMEFEEEAIKLISEHTDGGLRDAISLLDQLSVSGKILLTNTKSLIGSVGVSIVEEFLEALLNNDEKSAYTILENVYSQGYDLKQFQIDLLKSGRQRLYDAVIKNDLVLKSSLIKMLDILSQHQETYKNSIVPQLSLEVLIVKFCNNLQEDVQPIVVPKVVQSKATEKVEVPEKIIPTAKIETPVIPKKVDEATLTPTPKYKKSDLPVEEYTKIWKTFLSKINKPALHRSMQQAKIMRVNDGFLEIEFSSDFHFTEVNKPDNLRASEDILSELTKTKTGIRIFKNLSDKIENVPLSDGPELTKSLDTDDIASFFDT